MFLLLVPAARIDVGGVIVWPASCNVVVLVFIVALLHLVWFGFVAFKVAIEGESHVWRLHRFLTLSSIFAHHTNIHETPKCQPWDHSNMCAVVSKTIFRNQTRCPHQMLSLVKYHPIANAIQVSLNTAQRTSNACR